MIAIPRWRYAIGEPAWKNPADPALAAPPPPDVKIDLATLLAPVPEGCPGVIGPGGITDPSGAQANYFIDPPAGGFNVNDIIAQVPYQDLQTITATFVPVACGFPPGVYDVIVTYVPGVAMTNAQAYGLRMVTRDAVNLNGFIGGCRNPFDFPMRGFSSIQIRQPFWWRLAIYNPWKFLLYARTAVVDASTCEVTVSVMCRHAFGPAAPG